MTTTEQRLAEALREAAAALDSCAQRGSIQASALDAAIEAIAAYDAQQAPAWSEEGATTASAEGWCVSDTSDGFAEIQRIDETEVFGEDAQAIAHVYWMAGTGSEIHKRAIAYTLRDGNAWPYTQASIDARAKRSAHIRLCVNAHDGLVSALRTAREAASYQESGEIELPGIGEEWMTAAHDALAAAGVKS